MLHSHNAADCWLSFESHPVQISVEVGYAHVFIVSLNPSRLNVRISNMT
jgi:hypothetical protein